MALETATYINGLVSTNPVSTDGLAQADDHMRLIKSTIKATFPNLTGAMTATEAELNTLDGITASTAELNLLDGVTATTAELNTLDGFTGTYADLNYAKDLRATGVTSTEFDYLDGVTSNIQTQLNGKQATITGAASSVTSANLTASRAVITDASGKLTNSSTVSSTELGYLNGLTGSISTSLANLQTQINNVNTDLVVDTSPQLGGNLDTNNKSITFGSWSIALNGTSLSFYYAGNEKFRMYSNGAFYAEGDIGAYTGI